jgi:hypothetical protein
VWIAADPQLTVLQELRHPQALGPGVGEVNPRGDAVLEQVKVIRAADAGDEHVQVVDLLRVHRCQAARQEVRLLLVVALQSDPVAGGDERL